MTVKLYENDSYLTEFNAVVLSCEPCGEYFNVELDKTAFFPEGGGQQADVGQLGSADVIDVQIKNGVILHKTTAAFSAGETVCGKIDWETRFSRMQNHSGEHIVSGIIHTMFGYSNVGFHMGKGVMTLDTDGKLSDSDIEAVEAAANEAVYANRQVFVSYPTLEELKTMQYRSKIDVSDDIRIVTIDGYDCCACCAPHVSRTGEIGIIKILNFYPNKGGTRIELVCGREAFEDYRMLHSNTRDIMRVLSSKREEVVDAVRRSSDSLASSRSEIKSLREKLAFARLDTTEINGCICAFSSEASYDELRYCANAVSEQCERLCFIFSEVSENEFLYVVNSVSVPVKPFVSGINSSLNGRGGGKDLYAQGKVAASRQEILDYLKSVL